MAEQMLKQFYIPCRIIALAKGGLIPGAILLQYFPEAEFISLKTRHYGPEGKLDRVTVDGGYAHRWNNTRTLVVDDICDSGGTFQELASMGLESARFAALFHRFDAKFQPNYIGHIIEDGAWVDFPWEEAALQDLPF
jgi:hypothetical protein